MPAERSEATRHSEEGSPHTRVTPHFTSLVVGDVRNIQLELDIMSAPRQVKSGSALY